MGRLMIAFLMGYFGHCFRDEIKEFGGSILGKLDDYYYSQGGKDL